VELLDEYLKQARRKRYWN